ncbi:MAG: hypothetical protein HY260_17695 [Chloroflexi bacterium]|nr:hypothetical protein [Chloroflexota bacterium]
MRESSLSHVSRDELDRLYNEQGLTTAEIGGLFEVSDEVVRYRMNQLGIPRRDKSEAARGPRPDRRRLRLDCEELERLYVVEDLDTAEIGRRFGVDGDTVRRHLEECGIARRDKSAAAIRYPRRGFSGVPVEKAYLIGLRLGDLWVKPTNDGPFTTSITVTCTTTRAEQIELFQETFSAYGHVAVTPGRDGNHIAACHLNASFDFLLPKQDCIEAWILEAPEFFVAFLAGYTDAEGCFNVPADGMALYRLQSYDVTILHQIHDVLTEQLEIECPPPRLTVPKGSLIPGGYRRRNDCWALTVKRKSALHRLCSQLETHLKHSKRRQDMYAVWQNVIERGIEEDEPR